LNANVDDGDATDVDHRDGLLEGGNQVLATGDRPEPLRTLGARQPGNVDVRIGDALPDPLVLDRSAAQASDTLLMHLVVVEGAVVGDHDQKRNPVVHGRPYCGGSHHEIA